MSPDDSQIRTFLDRLLHHPYLVTIGSIVFLVIFAMAGLLIYQDAWVMRDQINVDFNRQQAGLAQQAAWQINGILSDIGLEVDMLKQLVSTASHDGRKEGIREALQRTEAKGLIQIGLVDPKAGTAEIHTIDGVKQADADTVMKGCGQASAKAMRLGPLRVEPTSAPKVSRVTAMFCTRVTLDGGAERTLIAKLDVSAMVGSVTRSIRSGKTGYAWVIDKKGMFLYHPEKEFIGKNAFEVRKERRPYVSFKQINMIMKDRMLRGEKGTGTYVSGWHRDRRGQIDKLIAFTPVQSGALASDDIWSLGVAAPTDEVADAVARMYLRHYAAGVAIVLGTLIFGFLMVMYQYRVSQALQLQVEETEASLHETERIYQRIVEQATDLIYIFDLDMRLVQLNAQTIELFSNLVITRKDGGGLPDDVDLSDPELWIGHRLDELMRPEDASFMERKIRLVLERKRTISYEHTITIEGRKVRLSTKLVAVRDEQEEVRYLVGISRDMTEQAEMDQRIYNTEKLASIGTLAAGVAHEINNPLAIILGFADLLVERFDPGSSEYEDLKVIETNANNAKKIVENMLTFARVTEGLEDSPDVRQSVETVLGVAKNTLMTKKIELVADLPEGLPRVRGDSREIQQVIFNLINNATAAMEKDGGTLSLSAQADDHWVHLRVTDEGEGIPDRIKAQIFDPFFTTKKVGEGTGLGLSLCYGIIKKYGGKMAFTSVSAEDNPDGPTGTTFTVSMPVDLPEKAAEGEH